MEFSQRLRELRLQKGLSQKSVADALDISTRAYSHYENGDREPSIAVLQMLCRYYEVSADYLIGLSDY